MTIPAGRQVCSNIYIVMKRELDVVAALIQKDGKLLLCQRKDGDRYGGLWEFPGGVVEEEEAFTQAIEREIEEELGIKVKAEKLLSEFFDEDENLRIKVFLFSCFIKEGRLSTKDCQDFGFFSLTEAEKIDLAPADKKILAYLKSSLGEQKIGNSV